MVGARNMLLFHHDPLHSDEFLDGLHATAREQWGALDHDVAAIAMGMEGTELIVNGAGPTPGHPVHARAQGLSTAGTKTGAEVSTGG